MQATPQSNQTWCGATDGGASGAIRVCDALAHALEGRPVFPCSKDKKPLTRHGFKEASADPAQIFAWWGDLAPDALGMATGADSGLWVLDIDAAKLGQPVDGRATLAALELRHGPLPATIEQTTGGGGRHLFFAWPQYGPPIRNSTGKLGPGLDVRGEGGYVLIPPSLHATGTLYSWVEGHAPGEIAPAEAPAWLLAMARGGGDCCPKDERTLLPVPVPVPFSPPPGGTPYGQKALKEEVANLAHVAEGQRNDSLNRAASRLGQLVAGGHLDLGLVEASLLRVALGLGLSEREARGTISSGLEAGLREPRGPLGDLKETKPAELASHLESLGKAVKAVDRDQEGKKRGTQAELLLKFAEGLELWHTADGQAFATIHESAHHENHPVRSKMFRQWLSRAFYMQTGKPPATQPLQDALAVIEARCLFEGPERLCFIRVGYADDKVYLDLGRPDWEVVEVSPSGWQVLGVSPVAFRRPAGLGQLPIPQGPGNLATLRQLVNLGPTDNFYPGLRLADGKLPPHRAIPHLYPTR